MGSKLTAFSKQPPGEGKWTRTPPGGDVAFVYDRKGLAEWIAMLQKRYSEEDAEAKKTGKPRPPRPQEWTVPQVAMRFVRPDGEIYWSVAGSATLWPEKALRKHVVWWSKPVTIPRISFSIAKGLDDGDGQEQDLGRADEGTTAGQPPAGPLRGEAEHPDP